MPRVNPVLSCVPQGHRALGWLWRQSGLSPHSATCWLDEWLLISNSLNLCSHICRKEKSSQSPIVGIGRDNFVLYIGADAMPITQTLTALVRQKFGCTGWFNQVVAKAVSWRALVRMTLGPGLLHSDCFSPFLPPFSLCIWVLFSPTSFFR